MPPRLFLIFNHAFTEAQEQDARLSLGVEQIISMPEAARGIWGNVPPDLPEIENFLNPVKTWLSENSRPGDYVLIQGDFGACFLMVNYAFEKELTPVYATTTRQAVESPQPDGTVRMTHHFRHQRFRRYGF